MEKYLREKILEFISLYPERFSAIMPALHLVQREHNNCLTYEDIRDIAEILDVSVARVYGVATYYTMYNLKTVGKFHLQVDTGIPAFLSGGDEILSYVERKLGIKAGETTEDGIFTISRVQDLASCSTCPVIQVNDIYYENMTVEKVDELISSLKKDLTIKEEKNFHFKSDCHILLGNIDGNDCIDLKTYIKNGGYTALMKSLKMERNDIINIVKDSMLRGRGGAGFPTGVKWGFLPGNNKNPVYLICNGDEGEPGTFKDRVIMEHNPHLLIEGIAISSYALKAEKSYIYIRGEFSWISNILEISIKEAVKEGFLSHVDIIVHRGAGSYVCGEETALIESIEGKRAYPRHKPPFPANKGLYNCPTIINNVETLSLIPFIIKHGPEEFKKIGTYGNFGPKLFSLCGHVNNPGVYELPLGTLLEDILNMAGGVEGNLKAVIVGGLSSPILRSNEVSGLKMDYDECAGAGTMLGSGAIIVMNESVSIPEIAMRTMEFYAHESCGQCVPCREGSYAVKELLKKIVNGRGGDGDIEFILKLCRTIKNNTICPLGDSFAKVIESMIMKFREEFDFLIKHI